MKKSEIKKLDDKNLQLRYYLGGLKLINGGKNQLCNYWICDINCSCSEVSDDEKLVEVKKFINKHNITNERFINLSYCFLIGAVMKYKGLYSPLFIELEKVIEPYDFTHTTHGEIPNSDFREKKLEDIVSDLIVKEYCSKYQLDETDFITLAKMSINYNFYNLKVAKNPNDLFIHELHDIIDSHGLYVSRQYIERHRKEHKEHKEHQETTQLLIDNIRVAQKNYLELMRKLQTKNPNSATEIISEGLSELGFNSRKDVKRLVLSKNNK